MSKQKRSKFDELSEKAWRTVGDLAKSLADKPLPVRLEEVASGFAISYVRFEPLLSTAKLVKIEKGFYILMNTQAYGANEPPGTILDINSGKWSALAPSLRFTIAHEIAHVVFFEAGWNWDRDLFLKHDVALESNCSQMARVLLVPAPRLVREWEGRLFDVAHVQTLLKRFRVSPHVFILRLHLPDVRNLFDGTDGMLAFARENENRIRIVTHRTWGPLATGHFRTIPTSSPKQGEQRFRVKTESRGAGHSAVLDGYAIDDLFRNLEIEAWLRTDECLTRTVRLIWRPGKTIPCEITACQVQTKPLGFLISFRLERSPEIDADLMSKAERGARDDSQPLEEAENGRAQ